MICTRCRIGIIAYYIRSLLALGTGTTYCQKVFCLKRGIEMGKYIDLKGKKFGRLTAEKRNGSDKYNNCLWQCKCDCGNTIIVRGNSLRCGNTTSCGCHRLEQLKKKVVKHGKAETRIYHEWNKIKQRCFNKNDKAFKNYGGRGITVTEEWQKDFNAFYSWAMANGYADNLTIDRINVNGNYEPNNCRWVTFVEQQNNRRNNHFVEHNGETHTIAEWARILHKPYTTLHKRIAKGKPLTD